MAAAFEIQGAAPYSYGYTIEVHGRSAHAGLEPERACPRSPSGRRRFSGCRRGRIDFETTGNVGKIQGGLVVNAVPDYCRIDGEMRSMEFEKVESLVSRRKTTSLRSASVTRMRASRTGSISAIRATARSGRPGGELLFPVLKELGMTPDPHPVGGGTDGNVFRGHGIASVVIGRGGYNQHTKDEYLVIPEMLECARVVEAAVRARPGTA